MNYQSRAWTVLIAGIGMNLCFGILYTWSVFSKEIVASLGWSVTEATMPYTVAIALFALLMVPAGRMQDKLGGRITASIGGLLCGGGLIVTSLSLTPNGAMMGFGVLTGMGLALGYGAATPTVIKWFPLYKKGLITGLVVAGFGGASLYASPLVNYLLGIYGLQQSFLILGVAYSIVIVLCAQFFAIPPKEWSEQLAKMGGGGAKSNAAPVKVLQYETKDIFKTAQFYILWLSFAFTAVAGLIVIGHAAKIMALQGAQWGFILVAILAIANALGRPSSGFLFDKLGRPGTCAFYFGLSAVTMFTLNFINSPYVLAFALIIVAFCYGSIAAIFPASTAEFFGTKNLGLNYGFVFTGWGVGGVFGSMISSMIFDATGSYATAFMIGGVLSAAAAVMCYLAKPPKAQLEYRNSGVSM
ncbi:L-lactate MFS transporter [Desulfotomaculum sp. 1211_IL3151]|uniref:L-lactate MFS transporter n=1 Tax=Desulfotomaculum sp. 1211_IL3151 TaxID=3084055 RepID=UPI002FDA28EA